MKKMRRMMALSALAGIVVLLGALLYGGRAPVFEASAEEAPATPGTGTPPLSPPATATPTPEPGALDGVTGKQILYQTEEIMITSYKPVYYCTIKKKDASGCKLSDLRSAVPAGNNWYFIDISMLSASREGYIGITTTNAVNSSGQVPVSVITVKPSQKKAKYNINWAAENNSPSGRALISSVEIQNADGTKVTYKNGVAASATPAPSTSGTPAPTAPPSDSEQNISSLAIQWKKGANGSWQNIDLLTNVKWQTMKQSGTTIYFRTAAKDQSASSAADDGYRYGKEVKLRISTTKAPNVKLDVNKLTVSLKNGMQFRKSGDALWQTLLPYSSKSTVTPALRDARLLAVDFNPEVENTSEKVNGYQIQDIKKAIGYTVPEGGQETDIVLEVRTAATTKKPASLVSMITIPVQSKAPAVQISYTEKGWKIDKLTADAADKADKKAYEYTLALKADLDPAAGKYAVKNAKWSSLKEGSLLKSTAKSTYKLSDGTSRTVKISDAGTVILVRRKGISGSTKKAAVPASLYTVSDIPAAAAPVTGVPTPDAKASGTPSPQPSVSVSPSPNPPVTETPSPNPPAA